MTGIEPASPAWEAGVLPMNYICLSVATGEILPPFYFNLKYLICQIFFMTEGYKLGYDTITITGNGNRFRKIFHVYNSSILNL